MARGIEFCRPYGWEPSNGQLGGGAGVDNVLKPSEHQVSLCWRSSREKGSKMATALLEQRMVYFERG
jgi:hypothetical protein